MNSDVLSTSRQELVRASQRGGVTLVLGAGISVSRGLPTWDALAQDLWREAFGRRRSPWDTKAGGKSPHEVPQFLPIVFELAHNKLGTDRFLEVLRTSLYRSARFPMQDVRFSRSRETLAVLARLILQEFRRRDGRRIDAIVTLNADVLLEEAVWAISGGFSAGLGKEIVRAVAGATHSALGGQRLRPIPIYHIHGFLAPRNKQSYSDPFSHMLVFTDSQYWSTSATALAFANRVMLSTLCESRCVFIGLSMTDINMLRWLALRTLEMDRDLDAAQRPYRVRPQHWQVQLERAYRRHFWIRARSDDPTGFLSEFLAIRGIHTVELKAWRGPYFQRLIRRCFPED